MNGLHSQMRLKDEIARELLAEQRSADVTVDRVRDAGDPDFLTEDCDTDVNVLTGDAGDSA